MKAIILGSGLQGTACAFDMAKFGEYEKVVLADIDIERAQKSAQMIASSKTKVEAVRLDLNDQQKLIELLEGFDIAVSAAPYFFNLHIAKCCIMAKVNLCDMGGNTDVVFKELDLDAEAKDAGILIIPDLGLAPGLANIIAAGGMSRFDSVDNVKIRVGGLPQIKRPPLDYKLVFSPYGLINEYSGKSYIIHNEKIESVDTLTGLENLYVEPLGELEAFHTSGGISTMPWSFEGKVKQMDYKTIRYKGHLEKLLVLKELGLMDEKPVKVKNIEMAPREMLAVLMSQKLDFPEDKDLIIMRVEIDGEKDGQKGVLTYDMLDYYDEQNKITAMMRTTAYPVSITAMMITDGKIKEKGALPPEKCISEKVLIDELSKRDIKIVQTFKNYSIV